MNKDDEDGVFGTMTIKWNEAMLPAVMYACTRRFWLDQAQKGHLLQWIRWCDERKQNQENHFSEESCPKFFYFSNFSYLWKANWSLNVACRLGNRDRIGSSWHSKNQYCSFNYCRIFKDEKVETESHIYLSFFYKCVFS